MGVDKMGLDKLELKTKWDRLNKKICKRNGSRPSGIKPFKLTILSKC